MDLFFYLIATVFLIIAIVNAVQINKGFSKNKTKKILIVSLVISLVFYGIGIFLTDNYQNSAKKSTHSTKKHLVSNTKKSDLPITKEQYKMVKLGMTRTEVEKLLGKVSSDNISNLENDRYEWTYSGNNVGLAYIDFNKQNNLVVEKSELFLLSDTSSTITDKNGTRNNVSDNSNNVSSTTNDDYTTTTNDEYADYVQSDIDGAIGSKVDWDFDKQVNTVKKVEVNDNLGKKDGSKLILVYLNAPVTGTNNAIKNLVNDDTLKIAKAITKDTTTLDFKKDSITYFWYLPLTDNYGKTKSSEAYKISLESGTLQKIDYNHLGDVNLPAIADQYNVLFKE